MVLEEINNVGSFMVVVIG